MEYRETQRKKSVGQTLAWIFFCAVCVQLALSQWYFTVISGEKTNLYFGALASLALLATMLTVRQGRVRASFIEITVSLTLLGLAVASGLHSAIAMSSSARAFVLMSTGLGGFWCARILLETPSRQKVFVWLCTAILIVLLSFGLTGQMLLESPTSLFSALYQNPHPLAHMLLLLAFSPLALIGSKRWWQVLIGLILLALTAAVLFFCATAGSIASAVLLAPLIVVVVVFTLKGSRAVGLSLVLLTLLTAVSAHYVNHSAVENFSDPRYQVYRVESYPFSWHVAKHNPLLGMGLRAPRQDLLDDYELWHPQLTEKEFRGQVAELVTPENTFLALLTGCGIPFTVIYLAALSVLLFRLVRSVESPPPGLYFHPLALLVAVTGSLLHSFTTDTMLHAQLCWFFHILLGLIPKPTERWLEQKTSTLRSLVFRSAGMVTAVIVGIVMGTHPALAPGKLDLSSYVQKIPILSAFYDFGKKKEARVSPAQRAVKPPPPLPGALLVELRNLGLDLQSWQIVFLLDNSDSMASPSGQWQTSRLQVARDLVKQISEELPTGSRIALRDFTHEISLKMGLQEIPIAVSQRIYGWAEAPFPDLAGRLEEVMALSRPIDLCTAVVGSSHRDFHTKDYLKQRIILFTDGESRCWSSATSEIVTRRKQKKIGFVDVVALGMGPNSKETFSQLSQDTQGAFLDVATPAQVQRTLSEYASVLRVTKPMTVEISGSDRMRRAVVGQKIKLPPGLYSIRLPDDLNLPESEQKVGNIWVSGGRMTTVTVSRQDDRLIVSSKVNVQSDEN